MSLINDALKRASESERKQRPAGPLGVPLQPVHTTPGPTWLAVLALPVFLITVLGLGVWLVVNWWNGREQAQVAVSTVPNSGKSSTPSVPTTSETVKTETVSRPSGQLPPLHPPTTPPQTVQEQLPTPAPPPVVVTKAPVDAPIPAPQKPVSVNLEPVVIPRPPPAEVKSEPAAHATARPPVETKAAFPVLKVQGIFYSRKKPSALINSKPVFIGDKVDGATVVAIEAMSVTVEFEGEKKVLSMN